MIRNNLLVLCTGLMFLSPLISQAQNNQENTIQIRIISEDKVVTATLNRSQAAQDFVAMLPLTLTLKDYGQTEKVSDLPQKLSTTGSPSGYTPHTGDIAYYAPWGNLAIFRRDFGYSNGLIKLGQINESLEILDISGEIQITFELEK